jgi:hypothetical protein
MFVQYQRKNAGALGPSDQGQTYKSGRFAGGLSLADQIKVGRTSKEGLLEG